MKALRMYWACLKDTEVRSVMVGAEPWGGVGPLYRTPVFSHGGRRVLRMGGGGAVCRTLWFCHGVNKEGLILLGL